MIRLVPFFQAPVSTLRPASPPVDGQQPGAPAEPASPQQGLFAQDVFEAASTPGAWPGAARLDQTLDAIDVRHNPRYQPSGRRGTPQRVTHCNEFTHEVMRRVGVPTADQPRGLANDMNRWLNRQGPAHGWRRVQADEAGRLASQGRMVLASQANPRGHGHVAVVRPNSQGGVRIAQAGGENHNDVPVAQGFRRPPQYFVYEGGQARATASGPVRRDGASRFEAAAAQRPAGAGGPTLNLRQQLTSPHSTLSVAIGHAEGTRTISGGRTVHHGGHTDPGNGRENLGTFSFQRHQDARVRSAEHADQVQLGRLRAQIPAYEAATRRARVDGADPRLQAAYFDLYNQSPRMAERFLNRLPSTLAGRPLTVENLAQARANAAFDDRGRFTARGLRSPEGARLDQLRRMRALDAVLQRAGQVRRAA